MSVESSLRDTVYELDIKNELLSEKVIFLQSALNKLDKRYRRLVHEHSKCSVEIKYLHR